MAKSKWLNTICERLLSLMTSYDSFKLNIAKNAQILESDFEKPQKLGNFPLV